MANQVGLDIVVKTRSDGGLETVVRNHKTGFEQLAKSGGDAGNQVKSGFDASRAGIEAASTAIERLSAKLGTMGHLGVGAWLSANVMQYGRAVIDVQVAMDRFTSSIAMASGSSSNAAAEFDHVRSLSNRLGLEMMSTANAYASFSAASRGTSMEGLKSREVFDAVAGVTAKMGLNAEQSGGVFLALSQMMSKGVVSAEEFRQQLGERLPIATAAGARALHVTTAEFTNLLNSGKLLSEDFLPKFAVALNEMGGGGGPVNTLQASLNRLSNNWTDLKLNLADNAPLKSAADGLASLSEHTSSLTAVFSGAAVAGGAFAALKLGDTARAAVVGLQAKNAALVADRAATLAAAKEEVARTAAVLSGARANTAILGQTASLTAATTAHTRALAAQAAAQGAVNLSAGVARGALALLGGPIGAITLALGVGAAAWSMWGDRAAEAAKKAGQAVNDSLERAAKLGLSEKQTLAEDHARALAERDALSKRGASSAEIKAKDDEVWALSAKIAELKTRDKNLAAANAPHVNLTDYLANGQTKAAQLKQALGEEAAAYNALIAQAQGKKSQIEQIESAHQVRLAAIAAKFKDKKTGTGRTSLGGGDGDKASLDAELSVLQDGLARAGRAYDAALQDRTISLRDYYLAKTTLDQQAIDAEIARTQASLAVQLRAAQGGSKEAVKAKGEVAKLEAELVVLNNRRTDVEVANAHKAAVAEKSLADELQKVRDALAQRAGGGGDTRATLEAQFADLKARLGADAAGVALVDKLIDVKLAEANLASLEQDWQRTTTRMRDARDAVAVQQQAGLLTQSQAQQQLVTIQQQAVAEMAKLLPAMETAATAIGPDAVARIAAWKNELGRTRLVVDEVAVAINGAAQNSFATLFGDIASGAMTAQAAFSKMAQSILAEIAKIAAQKMAAQLFANLGGDSGGLGGFISGLMRGFAGGGYVTGAGTATSDSIPARLSHGEFVMQSSAVQRFGVGFMSALNGGLSLPRTAGATLAFAGGGLVPDAPTPSGSNGQAVRIVNVIDPAIAGDYLNSSAGEKVILNVLSRNAGLMKHILA